MEEILVENKVVVDYVYEPGANAYLDRQKHNTAIDNCEVVRNKWWITCPSGNTYILW